MRRLQDSVHATKIIVGRSDPMWLPPNAVSPRDVAPFCFRSQSGTRVWSPHLRVAGMMKPGHSCYKTKSRQHRDGVRQAWLDH